MKKYICILLFTLFFVQLSVFAQDVDVTDTYLTNAGFNNSCNYLWNTASSNLGTTTDGTTVHAVSSWTKAYSGWTAASSFECGYAGTLNVSTTYGYIPNSASDGVSTGSGVGVLGVCAAWAGTATYYQNVTLPAGMYKIIYKAKNTGPATYAASKTGWVPDSGISALSSVVNFTQNVWTADSVAFTLDASTSGKIQVGILSQNAGSASQGRIFFDYVQLIKIVQNMEYVGSEADYKTTYIAETSTDNILMSVAIETDGIDNPLNLQNLNVSVTGTTSLSDFSNIKVYATADEEFSTSNLITSISTPAVGTFDISTNYDLLYGMNYIWIACDVSGAATSNELHLNLNNFTVSGSVKTPDVSSAAGKLIVDPSVFEVIDFVKLPMDVINYAGAGNGNDALDGANFTANQQNAIITFNGYQYITYWNNNLKVALARKKLPGGDWEAIEINHICVNVNDNHYTTNVGICPNDGTIHLAFDHHGDDLNYVVSVPGMATDPDNAVWSAASFTAADRNWLVNVGSPIALVTYPRFVIKPDGDMMFECRLGTSGAGDNYLWEYIAATGTWTSVGKYADGLSVDKNPYVNGVHYDPSGVMHISWVWRDTWENQTNHDISYGYSPDHGRTFYNEADVQVSTTGSDPWTYDVNDGLIINPIGTFRGLINQESQCVDSKGRIHILQSYIPEDAPNTSPITDLFPPRIADGLIYHIYQDTITGEWQADPIAPCNRNRSQIAVDKNDNLYVVASNYRVYSAKSTDNWQEWNVIDTSQNGTVWNEGLIDREFLLNESVLSFCFAKAGGEIIVPYYLIDNLYPGDGEGLHALLTDGTFTSNGLDTLIAAVDLETADVTTVSDSINVVYSGVLETQYPEAYTLYFTTTGTATVTINGEVVISAIDVITPTEYEVTLDLMPTHKYDIVIEGDYAADNISALLEWSSLSHAREVVPITALYDTYIGGDYTNIGSPIIQTSESDMVFDMFNAVQTIDITGYYIDSDVTLTPPSGITLDQTTITAAELANGNIVTVIATFDNVTEIVDGTITISTMGMTDVLININSSGDSECYTPTYPERTNLVDDPLLNSLATFGGWGAKSINEDPAYVYCGRYSGKVTGVNAGSIDVPLTGELKTNTTYRILAKVYAIGGSFQIGIDGYIVGVPYEKIISTTGSWQDVDFTITTGATLEATQLMYFNNYGIGGVTGYIDNWQMYEYYPEIVAEQSSIPPFATTVGNSDSEDIYLSGFDLVGNVNLTLTGANADMFTLSKSVITPTNGRFIDTITINYTPTLASLSHVATLTISSTGASNVVFDLSASSATAFELTKTKEMKTIIIDGKLTVRGVDSYEVYNIQGVKVADIRNNTAYTYVSLNLGVYIVKGLDGIQKVVVK